MDESDLASEQEQKSLAYNLAAQRAKPVESLAANLTCHNPRCGNDFERGDNRVFCDSRCAYQYQKMKELQK